MKTEPKYLKAKELCNLFNISIPTLYRYAKKDPQFPKPLKLSKKMTLWKIKEVEEYFKQKSESFEE